MRVRAFGSVCGVNRDVIAVYACFLPSADRGKR